MWYCLHMAKVMRELNNQSDRNFMGRLRDVIYGVVGACDWCLPRRVPASYLVAITYPGDPEDAEYDCSFTSMFELCVECTAKARRNDDATSRVCKIRGLES